MTVDKILRKAAAVMRKGGYIKGTRGPSYCTAPHCALGALDVVWYKYGYETKAAANALADHLRPLFPEEGIIDSYNSKYPITASASEEFIIAAWNNVLCNSAQDVAAVMEEVAEKLCCDFS